MKTIKNKKIHFIGIGGIGMSGLAEITNQQGMVVSGSDPGQTLITKRLQALGITIFSKQVEENISNFDLVVYSSAISSDNPELKKARELGITCLRRGEFLASISEAKKSFIVAGSHGKTTTTSILSSLLIDLKLDPTCIVGGVLSQYGSNVKIGNSDLYVMEADESDGSFLFLRPNAAIITNIDNDHLDHYGTLENLENNFLLFMQKIPSEGVLIINGHDERLLKLSAKINCEVLKVGLNSVEMDYNITSSVIRDDMMFFEFLFKGIKYEASMFLSGEHNLLNAMSAIALVHSQGEKLEDIISRLVNFKGVGRRFEKIVDSRINVIDDYAHHPTEISATLNMLTERYPQRKLVVVFEPHRYTRTKNFWDEFIDVFTNNSIHKLLMFNS